MAAYRDMYGDIPVDKDAQKSMDEAFLTADPEELIKQARESEERADKLLKGFQAEYPDTLNEGNVNDILQTLAAKASK